MKYTIINGKTNSVYHETDNMIEAGNAVMYLLPHPDVILEEEVIITVVSKVSLEDKK